MTFLKHIDRLEEIAKAATPWDELDDASASQAWLDNKNNNARHCRAFNPKETLRLLAALKTAYEALETAEINTRNSCVEKVGDRFIHCRQCEENNRDFSQAIESIEKAFEEKT